MEFWINQNTLPVEVLHEAQEALVSWGLEMLVFSPVDKINQDEFMSNYFYIFQFLSLSLQILTISSELSELLTVTFPA